MTGYRVWVNPPRTVLVRLWPDGKLEIAIRETPEHTWGPSVTLTEEKAE